MFIYMFDSGNKLTPLRGILRGNVGMTAREVLSRLFAYVKHNWPPFAAGTLLLLVSVLFGLVPPWLIQFGIDEAIAPGRKDLILPLAALMVGISLAKGIVDYFQRFLAELGAQRVIYQLRADLFEHLNRLSFCFYDESKTGDLVSRVTSDTETLKRFFSFVSINIIANVATILGVLVVVLSWDVRLGFLYVAILPLMAHAMTSYSRKVRPMFSRSRQKFAQLTEAVQESFSGIETVKLFGGEAHEKKYFDKGNTGYRDQRLQAVQVSAFWMPYVHFLLGAATSLVVFIGGWLTIQGDISIGILMGFTSYLAILTRPIRQTGMMINLTSQAVAGGERAFELLDQKTEVQDLPGAVVLPPVKGEVAYENVSFAYEKGQEVLKNVSFHVSPGETVAIVGPTGAGKTSLLHLLPRFYKPSAGRIQLDGYDIKQVKIASLRAQVGIAMQQDMLFTGTIRENIMFGNRNAGEEEMIQCAKHAHIHDAIMSFPQNYDTPVGERGIRLSGGEKQRVMIARLLLRDPAVVLMDEATSNLDEALEDEVQLALDQLFKHRTVFIIAHRLWTVTNAHKILVIKDGELIEEGGHRELMARKGVYCNMVRSTLK